MTVFKTFLLAAAACALLVLAFLRFSSHAAHHGDKSPSEILSLAFWQHMVSPGELSQGHAKLEDDCAACHTTIKGVDAGKCIVCHADNKAVLQRQPSAFHADIDSCAACHLEHQGRVPRTAQMDHVALARIGLRQIQDAAAMSDQEREALVAWVQESNAAPHAPQLEHEESLLNCVTCHQTKDRHRGLFGNDCAQCHVTAKWTITEYRHPSPASQSCAQCHQAPPSHYMMHFKMISMTTAHVEKADVTQCFLCHRSTSWNDIKGVGFYKHH